MGLKLPNTKKIIVILLTIIFAVSFLPSEVDAQAVLKSFQPVTPSCTASITPGCKVKITLKVNNAKDLRKPADIMLVMDRTGSMNDRWGGCSPKPCTPPKKITSAKKALKEFIAKSDPDTIKIGPPPSGTAGEYVGLVSYAAVGSFACAATPTTCATLEYDLNNMTPTNKNNITQAVNNLCLGSADKCLSGNGNATTIGAGLRLALQTLINQGRPDTPKFIVLATDGVQNLSPSPYELNIMTDMINQKITVFTIGIGDDVSDSIDIPDSTCSGCPDLDGNGESSGTEILKDIACKTDQFNDNSAENCINTWDTTNSPSINDLDRPVNAFFTDDGLELSNAYKKVQDFIRASTTYRIWEKINIGTGGLNVFSSWDHDVVLTNCTDSNPIPIYNYIDTYIDGSFTFFFKDLASEASVCINFTATVRDDISSGTFDVDDPELRWLSSWDETRNCFPTGISLCLMNMKKKGIVFIQQIPIVISAPPAQQPWIQTTKGDVGSKGGFTFLRATPTVLNSQFLGIYKGALSNFTSAKNWLVQRSATDSISLGNVSNYGQLVSLAPQTCPKTIPVPPASSLPSGKGKFSFPASTSVVWNGVMDSADCPGFNENTTVIFIDGNLTINNNFPSAVTNPTVVIVKGDITINPSVTSLRGIFIADGVIRTGLGANQLTVNGSLIGALGVAPAVPLLQRDLGNNCTSNCNLNNPAEIINFDPSYLYYFRNTLGVTKNNLKEERP